MSTKGKRLIYVGPADGANDKPLLVEGLAADGMLPGIVVENHSGGLRTNALPATTFGQEMLVANKNEMQAESIDTPWTINENMNAVKARSGEFLNVIVASGNNILTRGTALSLDGAGKLKIAVLPVTVGVTSEQVLAYSDEIINVTADALVRVRIA